MSDKQAVLEAVGQMPDTLTLGQICAELELLAALREGYADSQAGRVVPHEEIKRQYAAWLSK
jgi:predicted transcriptional regulator